MSQNILKEFKLILVGDSETGKSSFVNKLVRMEYDNKKYIGT